MKLIVDNHHAALKPRFIDLFAGCGGLSLGLHLAGWHGAFAIEKSPMAFQTFKHNLLDKAGNYSWPDWLPQKAINIRTLLKKHEQDLGSLRGSIDLVAGGPPCQGFSTAGRRRKGDGRNRLIYAYLRVIESLHPKLVFFENVRGFATKFRPDKKRGRIYANVVMNRLKAMGYEDVQGQLVDMSMYGVPQRRKRFIIVGSLDGISQDFFNMLELRRKEFLKSKGIKSETKVADALSDLLRSTGVSPCPDFAGHLSGHYAPSATPYQRLMRSGLQEQLMPDSHRFTQHHPEIEAVFRRLLESAPRNQCIAGKDREPYGLRKRSATVLSGSNLSPTITSIPDDCIHYSEARILTARECARLQSFPDWFEFRGKYTTGGKARKKEVPRFTQIGNAVPPLFAELAGTVLKEILGHGKC